MERLAGDAHRVTLRRRRSRRWRWRSSRNDGTERDRAAGARRPPDGRLSHRGPRPSPGVRGRPRLDDPGRHVPHRRRVGRDPARGCGADSVLRRAPLGPVRRWAAPRTAILQLDRCRRQPRRQHPLQQAHPGDSRDLGDLRAYQYGGNGADGIGFFLVDGSTRSPRPAASAEASATPSATASRGVLGGYLGVGLDAFGNFYDDGEITGASCPVGQRSPTTASGPIAPNVITLRGPGAGTAGYCWLDSTVPKPITNPTKPGHDAQRGHGNAARDRRSPPRSAAINVQITPVPLTTRPQRDRAGAVHRRRAVDHRALHPRTAQPPSTYKFGFSASTGGQRRPPAPRRRSRHDRAPPQPQLEKQVDRSGAALPPVITAGTEIPYQYTVTNTGAPVTGLFIADDQIATAGITCDATSLTTAPALGPSTLSPVLHRHRPPTSPRASREHRDGQRDPRPAARSFAAGDRHGSARVARSRSRKP